MKSVIVIIGASSGFGALAARALAKAGHTVYASMRETTDRVRAEMYHNIGLANLLAPTVRSV
jgi:NAD(P)-dependent dehydrogenase (short-subunit alcohol dehydrogenase family)